MAHKDAQEPPASDRSLRNPRRRNRVESESIKTAPRRKRSKLTETTFLPRDSPDESAEDDTQTNGHTAHNIPRSHTRQTSVSLASGDIEIPVRGSRSSVKRAPRADGARVLTQNENYTVKSLPSTPNELQVQGVQFRGSISPSANLALAITKEQAYIWDYNGHTGAASTRSIDIPFHTAQHDPLPFGAFVTSSGSNDVGLLLASAVSGKLVYHLSVERVASLGFFQERKAGVEGMISGLFSGEKIEQLTSADPADFVALLSSGRIVHISLRDSQGKPKIQTQVLYTNEQSTGGLFGSLKNILGSGAWKQTVSAVRIRSLERGQVQVLGLMEKGELRVWDLDWSGRYDFRASIDFRDQLHHELRQMRPAERHGDVDHMTLLDIAVLDKAHHSSRELVPVAAGRPMDAIMLVRCGALGLYTYALVEFTLTGNNFNLARILEVHASSQAAVLPHRPRVLVPSPGHTAFVVLPDAVAVLSLATAASQPEAQLHDASYMEPMPFQDAIYLRPHQGLSFTGGDVDASRNTADASCIAFVDGAGLVRITMHEVDIESPEVELSVKSKIEQAVFYGYQENNILDLLRASRRPPSEEDVEEAVVSISEAIIQSSSRFFDTPPTSVTSNLQRRAQAASHLAAYINHRHPNCSRNVRWQLLTDAEKIAAGSSLWELFEAHLNTTAKGKRKSTLLHEVCGMIQNRSPFDSIWSHNNSDDIVRTFFVTQLSHIGLFLPWTRRILESIRSNEERSSADLLRLVSEADDVWLQCLNTAWRFRKDNARLYGLLFDVLTDGTVSEPLDASELWTSSDEVLKDADKMIDLSRNAVQTAFENDPNPSVEGYVKKIATENPELVQLMCQVYLERISWCRSQGTQKYDSQAQRLTQALEIKRHDEIRQLAEVGQSSAGIALAEKYHDMRTLTEVLIAESQYLKETMETSGSDEAAGIQIQVDGIFNKVTHNFDRFGDAFAEAFFREGFADGNSGKMLTDAHERWMGPMTTWLRKDPSRAKICWINDVLQDQDFKHASTSLYNIAMDQEDNTWNRKVELSLAKLAMHASFEHQEATHSHDGTLDDELKLVDVQDRLFQHIAPETTGALDAEIKVQIAMEAFFNTLLAFSTWHQLMHERMARLLEHKTLDLEELVDLITLAEPGKSTLEPEDSGRAETFEALVAIGASPSLQPTRRDLLTKLCWKRAYLSENWEGLNSRAGIESEQDMQEILEKTEVYKAIYQVHSALMAHPNDPFAILEPSDTIGAGCHVGDLPGYVPQEDRDSLLEENIIMERQLEAMIREQNISGWVRDILKLVRTNYARDNGGLLTNDDHNGATAHLTNGKITGIKVEEDENSRDLAAVQEVDME